MPTPTDPHILPPGLTADIRWLHDLDPDTSWCEAERLAAYDRGGWSLVGCTVSLRFHGLELGSASLWGIESDSSAAYLHQVEADLIAEAKAEARATWTPERLAALGAALSA